MGGTRCVFRDCQVSTQRNPKMHFFKLPVRDAIRLQAWLKNCGNSKILNVPPEKLSNRAVCARHFRYECFMNYKLDRLIPHQTPTLARVSKELAWDLENLDENGEATMVKLSIPPTSTHLIPPEDFECPLGFSEDVRFGRKYVVKREMLPKPLSIVSYKKQKLRHPVEEKPSNRTGTAVILNLDEAARNQPETAVILDLAKEARNPTRSPVILDREETARNRRGDSVVLAREKKASNRTGTAVILDLEEEAKKLKGTAVILDLEEEAKNLTGTDVMLDREKEAKNLRETAEIVDLTSVNMDDDEPKLELSSKNTSAKREGGGETVTIPREDLQLKYDQLKADSERLAMENADLKQTVLKLEALKRNTTCPSSSLSKPQLYGSIKKYLGPTMAALVRMEMFGGAERVWMDDERDFAKELLQLGEHIYAHCCDEWRFRLPSLRMTRSWLDNRSAQEDKEQQL